MTLAAFEITLNEPEADALGSIERLARGFGDRMLVGAGTVRSIDAARRAIDAGATFLVSPHTDEALVRWAAARGIPALPGALTPTEVVRAWDAGAAAVHVRISSPPVVSPCFYGIDTPTKKELIASSHKIQEIKNEKNRVVRSQKYEEAAKTKKEIDELKQIIKEELQKVHTRLDEIDKEQKKLKRKYDFTETRILSGM